MGVGHLAVIKVGLLVRIGRGMDGGCKVESGGRRGSNRNLTISCKIIIGASIASDCLIGLRVHVPATQVHDIYLLTKCKSKGIKINL